MYRILEMMAHGKPVFIERTPIKPIYQLLFVSLAICIYIWVMQERRGSELADDGAFFLRYAQNMLAGQFWVWNLGEAPVWGASAPLYPLILLGPLSLGFDPASTVMFTGIAVGALSLAFTAWLLASRVGLASGIIFFAFTVTSSQLTYFVGSGLETPLTLLLLALALYSLLASERAWILGVVAGLLMVHKLDLVPAGGLLLMAAWLRDKRLPGKAIFISLCLALAWYLFAWWYFGYPVPNSFLTKALHQNDLPSSINWTWFGKYVLFEGMHKFLALLLITAFFGDRALYPAIAFLAGLLFTHLVAYTIKHPVEPYLWYGMASLYSMVILSSIGLQSVTERLQLHWNKHIVGIPASQASLALVVVIVLIASTPYERHISELIQLGCDNFEYDRAEAGRWVATHTPRDFVVVAAHGNPAYYSQRKVLDASYLNRPAEPGDLLKRYRPEIIISPSSQPDPYFRTVSDYEVVKVFDKTALSGLNPDYWFAVLARKDVISRISDVKLPVSMPLQVKPYLLNLTLGDKTGMLHQQRGDKFLVQPGVTTSTSFGLDAKLFSSQTGRKTVDLDVSMSPEIPKEIMAKRGVGINLTILNNGSQVTKSVIQAGNRFHISLNLHEDGNYRFIVDNTKEPLYNWAVFQFR